MTEQGNTESLMSRRTFAKLSAVSAAALALPQAALLGGCASKAAVPDATVEAPALPQGAATDEVLTFSPVSQDRMLITVRTEYNIDDAYMEQALEKAFPDVDFVFTLHCSSVTSYELRQSLLSGTAEDIILSPNMPSISDIAADTLLDLSGGSFADAYRGSALESCELAGKLYYLPGPANIYGIVYDKTLFEANGWEVPQSYSAFIELVRTIDATGIRAFQPTCKYARQAQMVFASFFYDDVFRGVENYRWLTDYQTGSASMAGHLEPAFERYAALADADVIRAADFDVQPGNRSSMMYADHACAMIIENQLAESYAKQYGSDHAYAMMPFWCGDGADNDLLVSLPNYYLGVNARLDDAGNEDKRAKVQEILAWTATPDGQLALAGGTLSMVASVKNTPTAVTDFNARIQGTIAKGNCVAEVNLMASGNSNAAETALQKGLRAFLEGTQSAAEVMAACDAARDKALAVGFDYGTPIGEAVTDLTRLQTGLFVAEVLRARADADIGLCIVGQLDCGELGRIYEGAVTDKDVEQLSLSVGKTSSIENDKKLWKLSMTGAELERFLSRPYTEINKDSIWNQPYFVASGLHITFAPWADAAEKLVSVMRADGTPLDASVAYTVALWCWPFAESCAFPVLQVFDDDDVELLWAAVVAQSPIAIPDAGSVALDWSRIAETDT